jgi:hypothetical protein
MSSPVPACISQTNAFSYNTRHPRICGTRVQVRHFFFSCRSNRSTAANDKTNTDCNNDRTGYNTNNSRIKRNNDSETITITPTGMCNNNNKDRDTGNGGCPNYGDNGATAHNNDRNMHNDNNNSGGEQNEGNTDGGCEDGSPGAPPHLFISFLMLIANVKTGTSSPAPPVSYKLMPTSKPPCM